MNGKLRIGYDEEGDYLDLFVGEPSSNYGEDISDDITLFKDTATGDVVGIGILNFRKHLQSLSGLDVELPIEIRLSLAKRAAG